jgi:hypothetical protein
LKSRIAELERRLGLNSQNSGKPPSSDRLRKPARVQRLLEQSRRKPGGQKGRKGETLGQVAEPDLIVDHHPANCYECSAAPTPHITEDHVARQVFNLTEQQLSSSPNIARMIAAALLGARQRARRFPKPGRKAGPMVAIIESQSPRSAGSVYRTSRADSSPGTSVRRARRKSSLHSSATVAFRRCRGVPG